MASSAKACFLLFLLTILSSQQILARESQFFNKVPSNPTNNNNVEPEIEPNKGQPLNKPEEEPNFIPENENGGYGLYGHESGQLPPSTTAPNGEPYKATTNIPYNTEVKESFPNSKYLPKNYNTEAYVTEPEGYHPTTTTPEYNNNSPFSIPNSKYLPKNYNTEAYVTEPEGYHPTTTTPEYNNNNNNNSPFSIPNSKYIPKNYNTEAYVTEPEGYTAPQEYNNNYNGENGYYNNNQKQGYPTGANGNNYYSNQQQEYTTSANGNNYNNGVNNYNSFAQKGYNHYNGGNSNGYEKQGMSDTRFMENGKYFYDISLEKTNFNPNENTRTFGYNNEYNNNNRGYYSNHMNSYENNNNGMEGYQNQNQLQNFQDEEDLP